MRDPLAPPLPKTLPEVRLNGVRTNGDWLFAKEMLISFQEEFPDRKANDAVVYRKDRGAFAKIGSIHWTAKRNLSVYVYEDGSGA